jgi:hypothetical protein
MFFLWFAFFGGSFVFLNMGLTILFIVVPLFGCFGFFYDWQGFIWQGVIIK